MYNYIHVSFYNHLFGVSPSCGSCGCWASWVCPLRVCLCPSAFGGILDLDILSFWVLFAWQVGIIFLPHAALMNFSLSRIHAWR